MTALTKGLRSCIVIMNRSYYAFYQILKDQYIKGSIYIHGFVMVVHIVGDIPSAIDSLIWAILKVRLN